MKHKDCPAFFAVMQIDTRISHPIFKLIKKKKEKKFVIV